MTRTEFLTHVRVTWGEVITPHVERYLSDVQGGYTEETEPTEDGFRAFLDGFDPQSEVESFGLDSAERVLFSLSPDRTLPNRVGTPIPVRDLWEGFVAPMDDVDFGDANDPPFTVVTQNADRSVSAILHEFAGYCTDQLHDDFTEPTDTDPTGPLPTLDAVRSILTGLTVPTRWEDATVQGGETVQSWEVSDRVKLVRTDRPDGSWSFTVHVEPVRTGWDAEGVPTH